VAHYTVFCDLITVMTLETIFHAPSDIVAVKVFPGGDTGVASAALCLGMRFVGKTERIFVALTLALGMPGLFEMAQTTVGLFPSFEMAFETTGFAGTAKSIVNFRLLAYDAASTRIYRRGASQRLPSWRQTGHALRLADLTIYMAGSAADRIFVVCMM
jgi:hypothetical protein